MAQGREALAAEVFEQAIAIDYDHPQAMIGLSKLLLNVKGMDQDPELPDSSTAPASARPSSRGTDSSSGEGNEEAGLNKLASINRALGLLETLVVSPRGWDLADAWFLLADALEKVGEVERAKCALWRVVELEDGTGIRSWRVCGGGVV
jgi:tetratricopeptide (TPR) repeat protein